MQSEHAHNNISHEAGGEPKVSSHAQKYALALAAVKQIHGASAVVHEHFSRRAQSLPFKLKLPRVYDQQLHHFPVRY